MRAYERLLQYARVYTTSDPESGTHPSAAREFDLAHMLVEEMKNLGIEDARCRRALLRLRHPARHPRLREAARAGPHRPHGHCPGCQRRKRQPHPPREL